MTLRNFELAGSRVVGVGGGLSGSVISVKGTDGVTIQALFAHDTWGDLVDLDDGVEADLLPNYLVGATDIRTNEPFISDEPVADCPPL